MSNTTYSSRSLIALPYPQPCQAASGEWIRTWNIRLCAEFTHGMLPSEVAARLSDHNYLVTLTQSNERCLEVLVAHDDDPHSDENFVTRPRRMLRKIEEHFGRIERVEGLARCLWAPFRSAFHIMISNPNFVPVQQVLEMAVRETLARKGWEDAVVIQACKGEHKFSDINFAQVSELVLRQAPTPSALAIQLATLNENVVLLADTGTAEVLSVCDQVEAQVSNWCTVNMALAS